MSRSHFILNRRGVFIPCSLGLVTLVLIFGAMGMAATSASRRNIEVVRAHRWLRLAAASAFEEGAARIHALTRARCLPPLASPQDSRDLSESLGWLEQTPIPVPLTSRAFEQDSTQISALTVRSDPWVVQSSDSSGRQKVREVGVIRLDVVITVVRAGMQVRRKVTVQRYAVAVPLSRDPSGQSGLAIVVASHDLYYQEDLL
jgi:hypothetical protein